MQLQNVTTATKRGISNPIVLIRELQKTQKKVDKDRDADIDEAIEELRTEPKQTDGKKNGKMAKRAKSQPEDLQITRFADP